MAEGGKNAKEVFRKTLPKLINTLGKDPPFTVVTASLNAEDLITDQELDAIKTKQGVERGSEVAFKLTEKIKESDDPNACLLTICDIFESEEVDNAILKRHGENMRASISNGTAATPAQVSIVTPSAPPLPSAAAPRTNELRLTINDLDKVIESLEKAGFDKGLWETLGRKLGLYQNTLGVIKKDKGDVESCFTECLVKWLKRADNVDGVGKASLSTLADALDKMNGFKNQAEYISECIITKITHNNIIITI